MANTNKALQARAAVKQLLFKIITLSILIVCILPVLHGQTPFKINAKGEVNGAALRQLMKSRNYSAVSAFDTVSKKPLLLYALYVKNNKLGIIDSKGKEITQASYDAIEGLNKTSNGAMFGFPENYVVKQNGKYGLITSAGKMIMPVEYGYIQYKERKQQISYELYGHYFDSLYEVEKDNKKLIFDTRGKLIRTEKMEEEPSQEGAGDGIGYSMGDRPYTSEENKNIIGQRKVIRSVNDIGVVEEKVNNRYLQGVINIKSGDQILPVEYEYILLTQGNYLIASKNKKVLLFDSTGKDKLGKEYDRIEDFNSVFKMVNNRKLALYSKDLVALTDSIYDERTGYANPEVMVLYKNGKAGIVTLTGKEKTAFIYDEIKFYSDFKNYEVPLVLATLNKKVGYISLDGKPLTGFEYDALIPDCRVVSEEYSLEEPMSGFEANTINQYHFFKKDGKYGLLDNNYYQLVPNIYDRMMKCYYMDFVYVANMESNMLKWGLLNIRTNKLVIPIMYDNSIKSHPGKFFSVRNGNNMGVYNEEGKIILPIENRGSLYIDRIYNGLLKVSSGKAGTSYVDYNGNIAALPSIKTN